MSKSVYLINPATDYASYFGAEVYAASGYAGATSVADLSVTTVAALIPDDFNIEICDEHLKAVDLDTSADIIAITGKVSQWRRMRTLAGEFRARGKTVVIGGPFASLSPEAVAEECDVLVRGEGEEIMAEVFSDLRDSRPKPVYTGTRPSLDLSPVPRWDLYDNDRAEWGNVQTSRGCPFSCEFCDVIAYVGRNQRHKPIVNVLRELDEQYRVGYRRVFLADDNLTVHRNHAKELLAAIRDWNDRQTQGRMIFISQLSIDTAKDDEVLQLCSQAGLGAVFIGLETPNQDSLKLANKNQNVGVDLAAQVHRFYEYGIMVMGGMVVGFDADGPDIFQRQRDFAIQASLPIVTLGALVAPQQTPLHSRLRAEERLIEGDLDSEIAGSPWSTNIIPKLMTRDELLEGIRKLAQELYDPDAFGDRMLACLSVFGDRLDRERTLAQGHGTTRPAEADLGKLIQELAHRGPRFARMIQRVHEALAPRPEAMPSAYAMLRVYLQVLHMVDVELLGHARTA